jgi:hypothetical protein
LRTKNQKKKNQEYFTLGRGLEKPYLLGPEMPIFANLGGLLRLQKPDDGN